MGSIVDVLAGLAEVDAETLAEMTEEERRELERFLAASDARREAAMSSGKSFSTMVYIVNDIAQIDAVLRAVHERLAAKKST